MCVTSRSLPEKWLKYLHDGWRQVGAGLGTDIPISVGFAASFNSPEARADSRRNNLVVADEYSLRLVVSNSECHRRGQHRLHRVDHPERKHLADENSDSYCGHQLPHDGLLVIVREQHVRLFDRTRYHKTAGMSTPLEVGIFRQLPYAQ